MHNNTHKYDDIINLPHHVSKVHPQMDLIDRAAQFQPFAALTGFGESIGETTRLTEQRTEQDDEVKAVLDEKMQYIQNNMDSRPKVRITYFKPDEKKSGGAYLTAEGAVKRIRKYERDVIMEDGTLIGIDEIVEIDLQYS